MTELQQIQAKATADRDIASRAVAKRNASKTKHEVAKRASATAKLAETQAYEEYVKLCGVACKPARTPTGAKPPRNSSRLN